MHDGIDWGPYQTSCFYGGDGGGTAAVPPPSDGRDERTNCQVVVRDLVVDAERAAAGAARLPAVLASPGLDQGCQDVVPPGEICAGDEDSGFSRSWSVLDFGSGEGVPSLSADGSRVAYDSESEVLTTDDAADDDGDTLFEWDGFVRTLMPVITAEPVDFGPADLGSTVNRTATLRVEGTGPLTIASIAVEGADFAAGADTCTGVTLHQGGTCLAGVKFTPTAPGGRTGTLVVTLADGRQFRFDLRGTGSETPVTPEDPEFSATPDPLAFGPRLLLSTDPTATLTISNAGGSPMTVSSITPSGDYTVRSTDCAVIAPAGSCEVVVQFKPTRPGPRNGVLTVASDAPGGPHLVALTGVGSTPALVVNPGVSRPGRVVTVSGTGFPASAEVVVGYQESIESAKVTTSNEGTFSVSLLVFPKASIGQRTVKATVAGLAADVVPPGRLLVVYPTMSPPEFLTRG
ncbi:choice-of-anchor D domain-containing protein [Actinokineospora soli]|uniref:Choice-of-anchor D domain-containing protein n=1 Tax=Actinokineospora soli TaxID=1048753 RepID=A0ABW2TW46_9PSEU